MSRGARSTMLVMTLCAALLPAGVAGQSPDPTAGAAYLRIVVSPPVAPLVDVYLDGVPLPDLTDFAPGSVSAYTAVPAGEHTVDVFADGSDPEQVAALATALIDFGDAGARTFAIRGDGSVTVLDDTTLPPTTGATLRLVNLDTDAGPVDAWLGDRPLSLGLSPEFASFRFEIPAGTHTLTTNAPGDRLSLYASEDVVLDEGSATTAFMVPTDERAVWFLATDGAAVAIDPEPSLVPHRSPTSDPDALTWRTLPVYECELLILFTTDGETSSTRRTGSARVRVPASLRGGLALYHSPVERQNDPLSGWSLGPDGWTCVRYLAGDFDAAVSGLTIRSASAGRAAAADCGAFGCDPTVGARTGRFIAYGSSSSGGFEGTPVDNGVSGEAACAYHRRFRSTDPAQCRGITARDSERNVPRRTPDGSVWVDFSRGRGGDTLVGAVGIDCAGGSCLPHLIECKLRAEDRTLCEQTLQVMLDPDRVQVPRVAATLACPGSVTLVRAGSDGAPPVDYPRARAVRTLRGDHDLVVDGVPVASLGSEGDYPRVCHGRPDRLWYRVRSVDGDRVNGWMAKPLVRPASS